MKKILALSLLLTLTTLTACGGGGSGSSGTVIEGTLTQKGSVVHSEKTANIVNAKHSDGERIGDVKICILNECSITDDNGQWGVNINDFAGGDLTIILDGHGINASTQISLPATAKDVSVDLGRDANKITVEKLIVDGQDYFDEFSVETPLPVNER